MTPWIVGDVDLVVPVEAGPVVLVEHGALFDVTDLDRDVGIDLVSMCDLCSR